MRRKIVLKAVHDVDLVGVLRRLGIYRDVVEGRCRCFACGRRITMENLGAMFRTPDGRLHLVCDDVRCLLLAAEVTARLQRRAEG